MTALHQAAVDDDVNTVRCLVDKGADLNIKDDNGGVGEWNYTADCKSLVQVCVPSHPTMCLRPLLVNG